MHRPHFLIAVIAAFAVGLPTSAEAAKDLPPIPEAVSSFGATVVGNHAYIFGGHMGRVPGNSKDGLSPHFARIDLTDPGKEWESLPMHESSQSPGLVGWNGKVYRVGGLSFRNSKGEDTAFNSLATFAVFDPATKAWTELEPLPVPRSSLDAAVVDGKLYVVGGWNLQEAEAQSAPWHEEALVFDLSNEKGSWKTIAKPPFKTRALAAAAHNHKLYVLGGMHSTNQTTKDVHVYDPKTDTWTPGPELAGADQFGGFAIAAFGSEGKLYYSGGSGTVYELSEKGDRWNPVERLLFSRMFHRLVVGPNGDVIVLGGVGGRTYLSNVESVEVAQKPATKRSEWSVEFPGRARHSQALLVSGTTLYAFGGNSSTAPHDFEKENFCNEAFAFDLAGRKVETLEPMPHPMQSGAAFLAGPRIDQSVYLVGGLGPNSEKVGALDLVQQYRLRSKSWFEETKHLPAGRSMFNLAVHDRMAWIFGGSAGRELATQTWTWDPQSGQDAEVVEQAAIPTPRRSFGGTMLGGKYYAVGGLGEKTSILPTASVFDFKTMQWTDIASPKHARVFPNLAAAGGKLYLSGGFAKVDGHFASATAIEVYDPESNTWSVAFEELAPRLARMSLVSLQDRLLFYSVDADKAGLAHFVLIDPNPQTVGYGEAPAQPEERSAGAELAAQLKALDKNGDGNVAADEVGERYKRLIARIDANKDGSASAEEIAAFTKAEDEKAASPTAGGPRGAGGGGGDPTAMVTRTLEENDKDRDGVLKEDEIPARMKNNLERIDTNKDGAIDRAELEAMFKSFRGRGEGRGTGAGASRPN
ncbi:Kelch repeat-containing protein [Caulifigura coniformis]|uniref:Kelch repeat-containing protein n=1 Tax=Caulifigura coniformis TaxID=2527983 RepID=UPI0018D25791|nr:kelch repeat-containing protein [Caulifigura coniformis]